MHLGNLADQIRFGTTTKTSLYKDARMNVMLLNLPEGEVLKPHISKTDAFLVVQKGECEFILEGQVHHLKRGDLFSFKANQLHELKALTDFSMLIIK